MIRVVLVDDQAVIRHGFRLFLKAADDIDVVGEAESGRQAVLVARELDPDVILMDIRMPDGDGLTATRTLAGPGAEHPIPIIIVTTFDLDEYLFGALEAGAAGFLLKDADPEDLAAAIRTAARGDALISPTVTRRIIAEFNRRRAPALVDDGGAELLTRRELDIVRALAQGMSNNEIAAHLHLETGTVKTHLSRITAKLGIRDRVQTVVWAFRHGITDAHSPDEPDRASARL